MKPFCLADAITNRMEIYNTICSRESIKIRWGLSWYHMWVTVGPFGFLSGLENCCMSAASWYRSAQSRIRRPRYWATIHLTKTGRQNSSVVRVPTSQWKLRLGLSETDRISVSANNRASTKEVHTLLAANACHRWIWRSLPISKSKTWYVSIYKSVWLCFIDSGSCNFTKPWKASRYWALNGKFQPHLHKQVDLVKRLRIETPWWIIIYYSMEGNAFPWQKLVIQVKVWVPGEGLSHSSDRCRK